MKQQTQQSKDFFDKAWQTYQVCLANNYLFHNEFYTSLQQLLVQHFKKRPIRFDAESQAQWFARFNAYSEKKQSAFNQSQRELVMEHMQTSDFPEAISNYQLLAKKIGFQKFDVPMIKDEFYALMYFYKLSGV